MTGSSWKTIFDIFGSKYTGEEYTRQEGAIFFNLVKKVYVQGAKMPLQSALLSHQIIFKIYRNEDVGSVNIPMSIL
jgi:hypothetical protein